MASNKNLSGEDKNRLHNQDQGIGNFNLNDLNLHATVNPATTMSATVILFIIAGIALLLFTRFEHSQSLINYYDEQEDLTMVLPSSVTQQIAEASTAWAFKPDHKQYLPPLYKLLRGKPNSDTLHYYIGVCYFQMEDHTNAIRSFRKVIRHTDSSLKQKAEFRLGLALWQAEKITEAQSVFEKISKQPRHPYREKAANILKEKDFS